ncbi:HEAT repeat-containing protein 1 [Engraulis encrasicolus]|uniref:HEAT repeat-containing protein 1 n=1 Tax=Engraulis encrasicolus TaxID=184585 RepID=UPI002FD0847C
MTSLAQQLKRLALPQNDPNLFTRREVVSVLFNPKEAASTDRSTFYALGCNGLEELLGIEPAFVEFMDTLFSSASMDLQRSVQSKEVNKKLDKDIDLFLTRLSPYFLLKPALKCIEWLIHRFHIHLYNAESLIACVLPYHETKVFVRVIQILKLEDPTNRWNWLHPLQKPGVPLARGTLLTHCYKDLGFMDFICKLVSKGVKAYSEFAHNGSCPQLRVIFSFYASTIVPALEAAETVTDQIIAKILPNVQLGLKSSLLDYKAASYMIVCQLAVKVVMEAHLVDALAVQVCKSLCRAPLLTREGLGCLIILLQNQKEGVVGPKAYGHLCGVPYLIPTVQSLASSYNISPLLRYLLPLLIHSVVTQSDEKEEMQTDVAEESISHGSLFNLLLQDIPLTNSLDATVAKLLLEEYISHGNQLPSEEISALNQRMQPVVRLFESRYSGALDAALDSHVPDASSSADRNLFHQFISLSMSSGKYEILADSDTSLMLSLKHPVPAVRNMAVEHLKEVLRRGQAGYDEAFLKDALLERLKDQVPAVVSAAMQALELYMDRLDAEDTVSSLLSLLQRSDLSTQGQWYPVLQQAVQMLDDPRLVESNVELRARMGWELLPYLVVTSPLPDSPELQLASCVAETTLLSQFPLTKGWAPALRDVLAKTPEAEIVGAANQQLISTLTTNLSGIDAASRRTTLEEVAKCLERQAEHSGGVREQAAFLVLSHTLLRGMLDLSETQHLLTAHRLFSLLEPAITELLNQPPEQGPVESCPPGLVAKQLGEYLHLLRSRQAAQQEKTALVLAILQQFISSLKSPQSGFKGETWWNPEKLDTSTCCYLRLLCRLFDVVITGASRGPLTSCFRALLQKLIQTHLADTLELFKFLSLLWCYGLNLSDQLECKVGAILQTQALYVGKALMAAQTAPNLNLLASDASPVVPSLLVCLCSPVCEVRRAAVACLQVLQGASSSPFLPVLQALLKTSEELISDASYLQQALGTQYDEALSGGAKRNQQLAAIEQLLRCIQSPSCPAYIGKALLRALQDVNGERVLGVILTPLDGLLDQCGVDFSEVERDEDLLVQLMLSKYNEHSAPLLAREPRSLEVLVKALGIRAKPYEALPSVQVMALEKITKAFFSALEDKKVQQKILGTMFDLLVDCKDTACAQAVSNVFKVIAVDAELVAIELTPVEKPKVTVSVVQARRSMRHKKEPDASPAAASELDSSVSWERATLILELMQHKKKLKRAEVLVPALFNLLSRSLEAASAEQGNMEYTKQLVLSCLLNVCQKISPDNKPVSPDLLSEDQMNVELVVQCVRTSDMPQTHHHALLLLGTVAGIFPEKVLHNIMPIFTFMGANIMRLDDAYSFQVINKTVQTVIPALIQAYEGGSALSQSQVQSAHMECVVTKVMHVFTDALPHVPEHRRLPILVQLLATLGAGRFLWTMLLLLFKQHATHTTAHISTTEKDLALENDMDFWISICCEFDVEDQVTSLIKVLKYLMALPQDKEEDSEKSKGRLKKKEESMMELIFSVDTHSSKELRHFKFLSVSFMSQLLGSNRFVGKVADQENMSTESLQALQQSLLEEILCYIHSVAHCVEANCNSPTAKFWRALLNKAYEVLDKVNSLLPTDTFIKVIRGLLGNQLPSVRRKAMELLNNKLQQKTQWQEDQVAALLPLTGDLLSILGSGGGEQAPEQEEQAINRQTALYSLKLLCRSFGPAHPEAFVPVLSRAVELLVSPREERNVMGSALLCIAEVTSTLKALAIPQLHRLMPAILATLTERKDLLSNEIYLLSAVTALQKVSETLPHFISPYLLDTVLQVTRLTRVAEQTTTCPQLAVRLSSLRSTIATKLPARVLLPTFTKCYQRLVDSQQNRLGPLMAILKEHITHMDKDQLNSHQSELTTFFLSALDFRAQHCQGDLEKTKEIEGSVIDCLLGMVMKLSEVTFRPLFFKLFDWCKTDGASRERQLTFYRLSNSIAEKLKGLFVLFAGQLVKPFADTLRQIQSTNTDEAFFDGEDDQEKSCQLLQYALDCLHKVFLYDTQRFLSKERAEALMNPLVDQLENMLGGEDVYQERVTKHLVPCIGQFAVAMGDDSQWKVLNYQVLLKTRHSSPKVRFSSLLMVLELAGRLKENYMVLLPETIPFLAELMEDECEEVEHQVQKVINEMESILGEPLQSYF